MTELSKQENFFVSWEELHRDTRKLARRLLPADQWLGVIAITRGGLVPAAIIARELNLRLVDTICIKTYDYREKGESEILKASIGDGEKMLLVDDLVDTGKTARKVKSLVPKARFVTVYAKPEGQPEVDDCIKVVPQNTWINFPWDMELNYASPLVDQK